MPDGTPPGLLESDFDTIHAAVMETARGRWFLAEYARRNRMADTRMILDAMARLENAVAAGPVAFVPQPEPAAALAATAAQIGERLADICWDLRERGFADDVCAAVDRQAAAVLGLARRLDGGAEAAAEAPESAPDIAEDAAAPERLMRLPAPEPELDIAIAPELRASMRAALAHLDTLPLATKLELFV